MRVHVGSKVAHRRSHPPIESAPESQVSTKTHTRRTDPAVARFEVGEAVNAECGVFIVGGDFLSHFPGVAVVSAFVVIGEGCRASKLVIAAWGGNNVAVGSNLTRETLDGAGD